MKLHTLAAAACLLSLASFTARAADTEPALAPFTQFVNAINAGDMKNAAAAYTPNATIIDEFPPYIWNSFSGWAHDGDAAFKAAGVTDVHIAISPPSFKNVDATHGYAVVPSVLTSKMKGKPMSEKGLFTFSTAKEADGWKITGWTWSTL